jgi:outer membrane immunogenic protein
MIGAMSEFDWSVAMRKVLLAAVMFGAVSAAHAADLPDLPILRGGFSDGVPARVNWQGFYIGGQAGYGSSDENFNGSTSNMVAALIANNVIQEMGVAQWNLSLGKQSARNSGFGGFGGYNSQWDDVVVGLEASYLHGSFGGTATATEGPLVSGAALSDGFFHTVTATSTSAISISDMATFRGRAGYAWGCFLPYMFGGFALGNADISRSVLIKDSSSLTALGPRTPRLDLSSDDAVHNHLIYGYTAGLGVDVNLIGGLFLRAEWEYIRFTSTVDTNINTVRAGLGYKF